MDTTKFIFILACITILGCADSVPKEDFVKFYSETIHACDSLRAYPFYKIPAQADEYNNHMDDTIKRSVVVSYKLATLNIDKVVDILGFENCRCESLNSASSVLTSMEANKIFEGRDVEIVNLDTLNTTLNLQDFYALEDKVGVLHLTHLVYCDIGDIKYVLSCIGYVNMINPFVFVFEENQSRYELVKILRYN